MYLVRLKSNFIFHYIAISFVIMTFQLRQIKSLMIFKKFSKLINFRHLTKLLTFQLYYWWIFITINYHVKSTIKGLMTKNMTKIFPKTTKMSMTKTQKGLWPNDQDWDQYIKGSAREKWKGGLGLTRKISAFDRY